ncbi:Uncharacterised protein [Vibrio cholerae]|uniref:Uncharacterized protein n=1 Tax=Vibrio cholerae TaxID=666 RepID=A0A655ZU53_VIBCL|nr:Uncharacterised protein [Vibrio cholerae]
MQQARIALELVTFDVAIQIFQQRIQILLLRNIAFLRVRVEIAIRAFLHAPRNMNV